MFEKELMINGIRKQQDLLGKLRFQLEEKSELEQGDCLAYFEILKKVEQNLRRLRKIREHCLKFEEPAQHSSFNWN